MEQQLKKPGAGNGKDEELEVTDLSEELPETDDVLEKLANMQKEERIYGRVDLPCGC